ncbi:MAG: FlgB family protein [Aliishimia sp.]
MFQSLEIFRMSAAMAEHAGRRQSLTAQNMANVDTPGYQAKRLATFSDLTKGIGSSGTDASSGRATRSGHLHGAGATTTQARIENERNGAAPDGNTVTVEREMLESVSAKREHDRALAIYKSALKILHTTLARS